MKAFPGGGVPAGPEPTAAEPTAPLELERFMPYRLSVLSDRISQALARAYRVRFGVSIPEWRVLAVLGRGEALSAGEVAARTRMDKVKVSRAVAAMERKGLLHRRIDPHDQRVARLVLSGEGRASFEGIAALASLFEARLLEGLDPACRAELDRAIGCLSRHLDKLEGDAACWP
jgi:DNA-binding MarR family transcriptional regulator